jgi:hypothetical protein
MGVLLPRFVSEQLQKIEGDAQRFSFGIDPVPVKIARVGEQKFQLVLFFMQQTFDRCSMCFIPFE